MRTLQPSTRALVIVLEVEALLIGGYQVVFERCFENTNGVQTATCLFDDIGHRLYLQGSFTHLGGKRKAIFIAVVLRQIFDYLHV